MRLCNEFVRSTSIGDPVSTPVRILVATPIRKAWPKSYTIPQIPGDTVSQIQLDYAKSELRRRYLAHEIDVATFASLSEDIKLAERRSHS